VPTSFLCYQACGTGGHIKWCSMTPISHMAVCDHIVEQHPLWQYKVVSMLLAPCILATQTPARSHNYTQKPCHSSFYHRSLTEPSCTLVPATHCIPIKDLCPDGETDLTHHSKLPHVACTPGSAMTRRPGSCWGRESGHTLCCIQWAPSTWCWSGGSTWDQCGTRAPLSTRERMGSWRWGPDTGASVQMGSVLNGVH
jgi:hypothetical protein